MRARVITLFMPNEGGASLINLRIVKHQSELKSIVEGDVVEVFYPRTSSFPYHLYGLVK